MDWILVAFILAGTYFLGKKWSSGWLLSIIGSGGLVIYWIYYKNPAFMILNLVFLILGILGYKRWQK